jgi:HlyD family secretion protein
LISLGNQWEDRECWQFIRSPEKGRKRRSVVSLSGDFLLFRDTVDIARKSKPRHRLLRRLIYGIFALGLLAGISWYVSRLKPAAPSVDRTSVWIDTVKRGSMLRQVRGLGKLVPEESIWIPAATEGRVERKLLEPGAHVKSETVLLELSNPQMEQEILNAEWDWNAEESSYADLKVRLEREQLSQAADMARLESDYEQAVLRCDANAELHKSGLLSMLDVKRDNANAQQLANRLKIEKQRLVINKESIAAQLDRQRMKIDQRRAIYNLRKRQFNQLKVRAGVLQLLQVEVGQRVGVGSNLARVANPNKLKAELNVAETQAKDIQLGQQVSINMGNVIVPGKVVRIDPGVKEGTVTVDVRLEGELPKGARPDLSVDGAVLIEKLENIVFVGCPVQCQPNSQVSLFKLDPDGRGASRVNVELGRGSVNTIEIKKGLKPDDQIILSDMAAQEKFVRIRLN